MTKVLMYRLAALKARCNATQRVKSWSGDSNVERRRIFKCRDDTRDAVRQADIKHVDRYAKVRPVKSGVVGDLGYCRFDGGIEHRLTMWAEVLARQRDEYPDPHRAQFDTGSGNYRGACAEEEERDSVAHAWRVLFPSVLATFFVAFETVQPNSPH